MTSFVSVDLPDAEDPKNVVRVGWSTDSASLQLGEFHVTKHLLYVTKGTLDYFLIAFFFC